MSLEVMHRHKAQGWNACLDACIAIVCPTPHKEEERSCQDIQVQLEQLRRPVMIGQHHLEVSGHFTEQS